MRDDRSDDVAPAHLVPAGTPVRSPLPRSVSASPASTTPGRPTRWAPTQLGVDLFNYEAGGHRPDGRFDFEPLVSAFVSGRSPDLILLNEAKFWARRGGRPLYAAAKALSMAMGRPYCAEIGHGAMPSAIMYDPNLLALESWDEIEFRDKRQLAVFTVRATGRRFLVIVDHWSPVDGDARLAAALDRAPYGDRDEPVLFGGDFNCTGAGSLLPQRDWLQVPEHQRRYKGMQYPDGSWGPDTRPLDLLIGGWDDQTGRRQTGRSWYALCDQAYLAGTPAELAYRATINDGIDVGGALLGDWLLINEVWRRAGGLVSGSYQVHIPPGTSAAEYPSDHRRISADLVMPT